MARYTIVSEPETDGSAYTVTVPTLPGCQTWSETFEGGMSMARQAIAGHAAALHDLGEDVPVESESPIVTVVDVDVSAA